MASEDDGFREIQLNGKQLIFLFMATTIVAVVIFLCGVTVGRGVRNATATTVEAQASQPAGEIAASPEPQSAAKPAAAVQPSEVPPPPPVEEANPDAAAGAPAGGAASAERSEPKKEPAKQTPASTAAPAAPAGKPAQAQAAPAGKPTGETPAPAKPGSTSTAADTGFVVQVAAFSDQGQAEAIVKRLVSKGYAAYVMAPPAAGGMYRVRVGKFKDRRAAEAVVRRLAKEEQFKPWIPPTR